MEVAMNNTEKVFDESPRSAVAQELVELNAQWLNSRTLDMDLVKKVFGDPMKGTSYHGPNPMEIKD
jgi:hypothetical protein